MTGRAELTELRVVSCRTLCLCRYLVALCRRLQFAVRCTLWFLSLTSVLEPVTDLHK